VPAESRTLRHHQGWQESAFLLGRTVFIPHKALGTLHGNNFNDFSYSFLGHHRQEKPVTQRQPAFLTLWRLLLCFTLLGNDGRQRELAAIVNLGDFHQDFLTNGEHIFYVVHSLTTGKLAHFGDVQQTILARN